MKGAQLTIDPEMMISAHPDDLALASRIAAARGETQAEVLGTSLRKLLAVLLPTSESFGVATRALQETKAAFEGVDVYPRARPGISYAEKQFIKAVCKTHAVTALVFIRTALYRYRDELVRAGALSP